MRESISIRFNVPWKKLKRQRDNVANTRRIGVPDIPWKK